MIPSSTTYTVKRGDRGVVVWAIQRGLNDVGRASTSSPLQEDGVYGGETFKVVGNFQGSTGLKRDGRFGPKTSEKLGVVLSQFVSVAVPRGLLQGVINAESGNLIGAVNASVPGGIDCGYTQRRVLEADYGNEAAVRRAFDGLYQMNLLARSLRERHDAFFGRPGARNHERAWRLATLNHNYPYAADLISHNGVGSLTSYWTTPQDWVGAIGAKFTDGDSVRTPLEWCQFYALGASSHGHPGVTTQFVTNWN
jgi:hypothetical protein